MSSNPFTVCACECVCVCMCAKACQVSTNYLDSSLALFPSMVWQKAKCVHTHTHTISGLQMLSYTDSMARHTHTQKHQTQLHWEKKNDLKVHLYFFSSLFRCGFLTVVGRLPQIFPALCTHARLGGEKNAGKKCWPTFYRGEKRKETKWRLKLCSAATALT